MNCNQQTLISKHTLRIFRKSFLSLILGFRVDLPRKMLLFKLLPNIRGLSYIFLIIICTSSSLAGKIIFCMNIVNINLFAGPAIPQNLQNTFVYLDILFLYIALQFFFSHLLRGSFTLLAAIFIILSVFSRFFPRTVINLFISSMLASSAILPIVSKLSYSCK